MRSYEDEARLTLYNLGVHAVGTAENLRGMVAEFDVF